MSLTVFQFKRSHRYLTSQKRHRERELRSDLFSLVSQVRTFGDLSTLSDRLGHKRRLVSLSPMVSNLACVRRHRSVCLSFCPSAIDRCTMHTSNQKERLARVRLLYDRRNRMLSRDDKSIAQVVRRRRWMNDVTGLFFPYGPRI